MPTINIFEAKSSLSRLIKRIESGAEAEIIIARHGRPVAKLVGIAAQTPERLLLVVMRWVKWSPSSRQK